MQQPTFSGICAVSGKQCHGQCDRCFWRRRFKALSFRSCGSSTCNCGGSVASMLITTVIKLIIVIMMIIVVVIVIVIIHHNCHRYRLSTISLIQVAAEKHLRFRSINVIVQSFFFVCSTLSRLLKHVWAQPILAAAFTN